MVGRESLIMRECKSELYYPLRKIEPLAPPKVQPQAARHATELIRVQEKTRQLQYYQELNYLQAHSAELLTTSQTEATHQQALVGRGCLNETVGAVSHNERLQKCEAWRNSSH